MTADVFYKNKLKLNKSATNLILLLITVFT